MAQLSVQISLFVKKGVRRLAKRKKCPNNAFYRTISLLIDLALSNDQLAAWSITLLHR